MAELKCTNYLDDLPEGAGMPCQCPVCGGFLKWVENKPICNKCSTELITIPYTEEQKENLEIYSDGKICPISKPKKDWKQQKKRNPKKTFETYGYPLPKRPDLSSTEAV